MPYQIRPAKGSISATELAKLGLCEKRLYLDSIYGRGRDTAEQKEAKARGNDVHEASRLAALATPASPRAARDTRCFIASAVYGPHAIKTDQLRAWRDDVLMRSEPGRLFVRVYYAVSPPIARALLRWPAAAGLVRQLLDRVVAVVTGQGGV
jgi:hypothetical protein